MQGEDVPGPLPEKRKKSHGSGPNFLHNLVGKKISISDGTEVTEALLVGYNRYDLLVKDEEGHKIIMKHAITLLGSAEGEEDPFEPELKKDEGEIP